MACLNLLPEETPFGATLDYYESEAKQNVETFENNSIGSQEVILELLILSHLCFGSGMIGLMDLGSSSFSFLETFLLGTTMAWNQFEEAEISLNVSNKCSLWFNRSR